MFKLNQDNMLQIDGSFGEGGGSIVRISSGLACLKKIPIEINNIRFNRKNPGLRLQHLVGINTLAKLTGGSTNSLDVGSTFVKFNPGSEWNTNLNVHIRTAGNIGMLSQTIYNALYLAPPQKYQIHVNGGGTYGTHAAGTSYLSNVIFPIFKNLGYSVNIDVIKHGFYPKGGGKALITIIPSSSFYKNLNLEERGELEEINGHIHVENSLKKPKVAERILSSILQNIKPNLTRSNEIQITTNYHNSLSVGVGVDIWCKYSSGAILGIGTTLGKRGVSSEKVGIIAANKLNFLLESSETVDEYASDQILPLLFVAKGPSKFVIRKKTMHFLTNLELLKGFFKRNFIIKNVENGYFVHIL
ncbi:RNA 3'-terminal phosphate cyclase [Promethearchaeum syntrophicum]|uniref:RNA 3'-terminal phosphate cyclase n=1 Tax=Promethearchaeum syntrophicum TaxID=2594042 RepID=A0A5B9D5I2_9ARCH|nr:RNA 3'-terminal phosphate cyclase [Candidatus Prometheoarchaeum syntrophicum]QEE14305.1 RNA 3'-terminal-phosphate cyclase [Candidatus Prometheoarchaeum syntrophicum]